MTRAALAEVHTERTIQNKILTTLPPEQFDLLRSHLSLIELKKNAVIHEANRPIEAMYFVESGIVSRVARTTLDGPVEVAVVGRRGLVGVSLLLGSHTALQRTIVQIPGEALKISADSINAIMVDVPAIREHLLRYVQLLIQQKAQVALCNAKHELDARVARWLLLAFDRIDGNDLPVTHDLLASMLGVRRPGVSDSLARLEAKGIISKSRGALKIVNFEALKSVSCECYRLINDRYETQDLLPQFQHVW